MSGTITITGAGADDNAKQAGERDKGVIVKNCAPFTDRISVINNTQIYNTKDLDVVMPMYNLIEYSNNYSKTSGSLSQYCRDDPNDNIVNSESLLLVVKTEVPLKYLSNFWRTLEMPLISCEINLILTWSADSVISSAAGKTKFAITDTHLYFPIVTLSTQDNAELLAQLKSSFKRTINWNKYQSKVQQKDKTNI